MEDVISTAGVLAMGKRFDRKKAREGQVTTVQAVQDAVT